MNEKKEVVNAYMAKKSIAKLDDMMISCGMSYLDMKTIKRLPISHDAQVAIVENIIYETAMGEEKQFKDKV